MSATRKAPAFLTLEEVLALHADQIERYGGTDGVRDPGLLSSAVAMPRASFDGAYLHPTLHEMAAAYLFHLTRNHPFLDGNKRIGLASALTFLGLNDVVVESTEGELVDLVLRVATSAGSKAEVAEFLRERSRLA